MTTFNLSKDMGIAPMVDKEISVKTCLQCDGKGMEETTGKACRRCLGAGEQKIPQKTAADEDVFKKHQKKIAISTLKMSDAGANIMGGMTKDEARDFLRSIGYSSAAILNIEGPPEADASPKEGEEKLSKDEGTGMAVEAGGGSNVDVRTSLEYMIRTAAAEIRMAKVAGDDESIDLVGDDASSEAYQGETPEAKKTRMISNIASMLFAGDEQRTKDAYAIVANATNLPADSMKTDPSEMRSYILASLKRIRIEDVEAVLYALKG